jgi:hypothetical protein
MEIAPSFSDESGMKGFKECCEVPEFGGNEPDWACFHDADGYGQVNATAYRI